MPGNSKFMVRLLESIDSKHLFMAIWLVIGAFFAGIFYLNYRKTLRRNFRSPNEGPGPRVKVDHRQLSQGTKSLPDKK